VESWEEVEGGARVRLRSGAAARSPFLAFKYRSPPVALGIDVARNSYFAEPQAVVTHADLTNAVATDQAQTTELLLWVRNNDLQFLTVRLPAGARLVSDVFVAGAGQQPMRREGADDLLVRLPAGAGREAFPVRLVYEQPSPDPGRKLGATGRLAVPVAEVAGTGVLETRHRLFMPEERHYTRAEGPMSRAAAARGWSRVRRLLDPLIPAFGPQLSALEQGRWTEPPAVPVETRAVFGFQVPQQGHLETLRRRGPPAEAVLVFRARWITRALEAGAFLLALLLGLACGRLAAGTRFGILLVAGFTLLLGTGLAGPSDVPVLMAALAAVALLLGWWFAAAVLGGAARILRGARKDTGGGKPPGGQSAPARGPERANVPPLPGAGGAPPAARPTNAAAAAKASGSVAGVEHVSLNAVPYLPPGLVRPRAFRATGGAGNLTAVFNELSGTAGQEALVTLAEFRTLLRADGELWEVAVFSLLNRSLQFLPVLLPEGAELLAVSVGGVAVRADQERGGEARARLVPLIQTRPGERATQVRLMWRLRDAVPPGGGRVRLEDAKLPGLSAERTTWSVWAPAGWALEEAGGNMTRVDESDLQFKRLEGWLTEIGMVNRELASGGIAGKDAEKAQAAAQQLAEKARRSSEGIFQSIRRSKLRMMEQLSGYKSFQDKLEEQVNLLDLNRNLVTKRKEMTAGETAPVGGQGQTIWVFNNLPSATPREPVSALVARAPEDAVLLNDNVVISRIFSNAQHPRETRKRGCKRKRSSEMPGGTC
jgi:hypothetical protein